MERNELECRIQLVVQTGYHALVIIVFALQGRRDMSYLVGMVKAEKLSLTFVIPVKDEQATLPLFSGE